MFRSGVLKIGAVYTPGTGKRASGRIACGTAVFPRSEPENVDTVFHNRRKTKRSVCFPQSGEGKQDNLVDFNGKSV